MDEIALDRAHGQRYTATEAAEEGGVAPEQAGLVSRQVFHPTLGYVQHLFTSFIDVVERCRGRRRQSDDVDE